MNTKQNQRKQEKKANRRKGILVCCFALLFMLQSVMSVIPAGAFSGILDEDRVLTLDIADGDIVITKQEEQLVIEYNGGTMKSPENFLTSIVITQANPKTPTTHTITIRDVGSEEALFPLTLNNVNIVTTDLAVHKNIIDLKSSDVLLTLSGSNTIQNENTNFPKALLHVDEYSTLTINGTGSLVANAQQGYAAAIGGDYKGSVGRIVITEGVISGISQYGAGIGSGYRSSGTTNIKITGGEVSGKSYFSGAGIGSGQESAGETNITISDGKAVGISEVGAGIGSGVDSSGKMTVTIDGGSVKARSSESKNISSPKNGRNESLVLTTINLSSLGKRSVSLMDFSLIGYDYYGTSDMYTDEEGMIYLYLPSNTQTTVALGWSEYTLNVEDIENELIINTVVESKPKLTGTYGTQVKDMVFSQPGVVSGNGISIEGIWAITDTEEKKAETPTVGTQEEYRVTFTPTDGAFSKVSVRVIPDVISPTPTATPLPTATPSPTPSPTATPSPTPSPTATPSPTPSPTATPSPTPSPSPTPTPTATPLPTATPSPTPSPTATPSPLPTATPSPSPSPSSTPTVKPTSTPSSTPTPTPSVTPKELRFQKPKTVIPLGGEVSFTLEVSGYEPEDIVWYTERKNRAVVGKNKGELTATVSGKTLGNDTILIKIKGETVAELKVRVAKCSVGFVTDIKTMKVGEKLTFALEVKGYDKKDILWYTKRRNRAVVGKNAGRTKAVVTAKSKGTDTLYVVIDGKPVAETKIIVK